MTTDNEATAKHTRRKFSLDQLRIDLVKAAPGTTTKIEAITPMDVASE